MAFLQRIYSKAWLLRSASNVFLNNCVYIRPISSSCVCCLKQFVETTKGKVTELEATYIESDRTKNLLPVPPSQTEGTQCVLCRLDLPLKYTDVLILRQFVDEQFSLLPRSVTGLCSRQYGKVRRLVWMSKMAGLMPDFTKYTYNAHPKDTPPEMLGPGIKYYYKWSKWNLYYKPSTYVDMSIHEEMPAKKPNKSVR